MVRTLITYALFPANFLGGMAVALWCMSAEVDHGLALVVVTAVTLVIVAIAERIHPAHPEWNRSRGDIVTDLWHGLISNVTVPEVLKMGVFAGLLSAGFADTGGIGWWPHDWPLGLQLILALVVGQFGEYWAHRSLHEVPWLWRFHAVHHSPERLYFLNAARFHPVDTTFLYMVGVAPLMVFGAGADLMLLVMVWIAMHGLYQHCNVHLRLGLLNYVFSMAELHRWHHSLNIDEANRNYGNNILFWDLVFGTVHWPRDRDASSTIGNNIPEYPRGYLGQLAAPFRD